MTEASHKLPAFAPEQVKAVNHAVTMAEEIVSNAYKMSTSQWLRRRYDVRTLVDLKAAEIENGPFAQVVRYKGQRPDTSLGSNAYDHYRICLQDHAILDVLKRCKELHLLPFVLYIVTHELIHIIRFSQFLQFFDASPEETLDEEHRVHRETHRLLFPIQLDGLDSAMKFFEKWHNRPIEARPVIESP
ncbi:MAG: hypothetical protein ABIL58_19595 [Pseudomonadota bacterium]